jgi:hypothetical protein
MRWPTAPSLRAATGWVTGDSRTIGGRSGNVWPAPTCLPVNSGTDPSAASVFQFCEGCRCLYQLMLIEHGDAVTL